MFRLALVVLGIFCPSLYVLPVSHTVSSLALYPLLERVEKNIINSLQNSVQAASSGDEKSRLSASLKLMHEASVLLQSIVDDFNKGCLSHSPEIQRKFFAVCDACKGITFEEIEPHCLRTQVEKSKEFNAYIVQYCLTRRAFLNYADFELFNKMVQFNQIIITCFGCEELFDIDYATKALDWLVHRPSEFIYQNRYPLLLATAVIVGGVLLCKYCLKQEPQGPYDIRHIDGRRQHGNECGFNAALHAVQVAEAQTDEQVQQRLQAIVQAPNAVIDNLRGVIDRDRQPGARGRNVGINNLANDEIERIVHGGLLDGVRRNIPVIQRLNEFDPIHHIPGVNASNDMFHAGVRELREHRIPQTVILRLGNALCPGHWVVVKVMPDPNGVTGITAFAINSTGRDITNHPTVRGLLERYAPVPQA